MGKVFKAWLADGVVDLGLAMERGFCGIFGKAALQASGNTD